MQLFRTEMLFLHPPEPVAPRVRYGHRRPAAPRYGHARVRLHDTPSRPLPPAALPDHASDPAPDLERAA